MRDGEPVPVTGEEKVRWVGHAVTRVEDRPLLIGAGRFTDDHQPARTLHVAFVRSPLASARIRGIDTAPAGEADGVEAVFTAAELDVAGLRARLDRPGFVETEMPLLAHDRVRHVGEPVAMVLADTPYAAEDGAELVEVDYDERRPVTSMVDALTPDAEPVHDDAGGNVLLEASLVDDPELDQVLDDADLCVDLTFRSGRLTAVPLEARACLGEWDDREERLLLTTSTQVPHLVRTTVATLLGVDENRVRVIAPDVGGGFGQKCVVAREEVLVAAAALHLRRPVKWIEDRGENLLAAFQGHEQRYEVTAGFTRDGKLVGLAATVDCDVGAYSCYPFSCGVEPLMASSELPGCYTLPHYRVSARAISTNKPPMAPYRGVSRPQIVAVMERLMDKAAARLGVDRAEIRRRNLIGDEDFPYVGASGISYDRGSYLASLDRCLDAVDAADWPTRQARARADGRLLGLGFACFSERTGYGTSTFAQRGMGITPGFDSAEIRMDPTATVTVAVGISGHGQGHRTSLAQVVADELGVDLDDVRVVHGDTDATPYGWGTFASRSAVIGGGACKRAASTLAAKLKRIASHLLGAEPEEIALRARMATVEGEPDRTVPLREVARIAHHAAQDLPEGETGGLVSVASFDPPGTFSNATHAVVLEVIPETGGVRLDRYVVAEDCGVVINPLIVDGQVRGGVAQGIAAALYEQVSFDEAGQCQTATLMDYLVPTAAEIPPIEIHHLETPSEHSETGAKGMGEGGTIGAPATVLAAVNDAVAHLGVEVDEIPITPERLRSLIATAEVTP